MELPRTFRHRFNKARGRVGISLAQLARLSTNSPTKLQDISNGKFDHSKDGPGIFGIQRTTRHLQVTLNDLVPPEIPSRPGINKFLSRFEGKDTPISRFADLLDFCDIYKKPEGGASQIDQIGSKSLLVIASGISDPALLQIAYEQWPLSRRKKIYNRQALAWDRGHIVDSEIYDASYAENYLRPAFSLLLAACRVRDLTGLPRLLIYAEPIGEEF